MVLLSRFVWIMASRVISSLLQAVTLILVAREAGPSAFGVLAAFMGVVVIIQVGSDCGIATFLIRLRAKDPESGRIAVALRVHRLLGIIACALLVAVAIVTAIISRQAWWLLILLAFAGYMERQSDVRLSIALADGDVWKNAINLAMRRLITFLVTGIGSYLALNIVLAFGIGSFLGALCSLWLSQRLIDGQRPVGKVGISEFKQIFEVSRAFWMNSIGVQIRNLDVLLVAAIGTPTIAGYYGSIARSINPLTMISSSLAVVLLPAVSRTKGKLDRSVVASIGIVITLFSSLYLGLAFHADQIVALLFGPVYAPAADGFRIAFVGLIFASCSALFASILQARGFEGRVGQVSVTTSVFALSGVTAGVYCFGIIGAVFGLLIAYFIQFVSLLLLIFLSQTRQPVST